MSEQRSQKSGSRSEAQKETRAREGYDTQPASSHAAGAFGKHGSEHTTDHDASLKSSQKTRKQSEGGKQHDGDD